MQSRIKMIEINVIIFVAPPINEEYNVPIGIHDRFVICRRDDPLVGKSVCARAFSRVCARVCVEVIDVCHDASPRMVMCT